MSSFESTAPQELADPAVRAAEVPEPGAVTVVVPTFNESANIRQLLRQITESVPQLGCPARSSSWTTPPTTPPR